ncbi:hypothetical protein Syun_023409 [Stephania yunnanensis]|uniref:Uncharacterized protein n=1 Tax=Stephania yunnanensis TaxID=152371 RepID=A0AAP0HZK2_9MAGN
MEENEIFDLMEEILNKSSVNQGSIEINYWRFGSDLEFVCELPNKSVEHRSTLPWI